VTELFRDPIWQAVGVFLGLLGIVVAIMLARSARARKRLAYSYSRTSVLSVDDSVRDKIKVFFHDQKVEDVYLGILKFVNVGNQPIRGDDFETPIQITIGGSGKMLTAEILDAQPPDLNVHLEPTFAADRHLAELELMPLLLNPLDTFRIRLLVSGKHDGPVLKTRIAGGPRLDWFDEDFEAAGPKFFRVLLWTVFMFGTLAVGTIVTALPSVIGFVVLAVVGFAGGFWLSNRVSRYIDPFRKVR
jgi:hypothetical protein